jgi:hypothetical protein
MIAQSGKKKIFKLQQRAKNTFKYLRAKYLRTNISSQDIHQKATPIFISATDLARYMRERVKPCFFIDSTNQKEMVALMDTAYPKMRSQVVHAANQVCHHTFDLLGSGPMPLGESINWHCDFKTNHRWNPRQYYTFIRPARYPGGYDIKIPWELSRFQHLPWLGQAYWFTNDEIYAQEFYNQVGNWIQSNPTEWGVNWACTMDVAIRAINWIWGYFYMKDSPCLDDDFLIRFFKSLWLHGHYIRQNLERMPTLTNNHYLADLAGLVFVGFFLPEFKETQQWLELGLRELESEMFVQVYPDGVGFEASTSYHRLTTELFLTTAILARLNGYSFSPAFTERLEKMLAFIQQITRPDGTTPLIGDHDNGRLQRLHTWEQPGREWVDFRYLLAIGAVFFQRDDFGLDAGDQWEEATWFFGRQAVEFQERCRTTVSTPDKKSFSASGLYILRSGDTHITVNAAPNGQNGIGGHAHNDKLSLTLQVHHHDWLIDCGTYTYTQDYEARNTFRSARLHNVLSIDGKDQIPIQAQKIFVLQPDIPVKVNRWEAGEDYDLFDATLDYGWLYNTPLTHRRRIYLSKGSLPYCLVDDVISGGGSHTGDLRFQIGSSNVNRITPNYILLENNEDGCRLGIAHLAIHPFTQGIERTERSMGYGMKIANQTLWYRKSETLPIVFHTIFCWGETLVQVGEDGARVQQLIPPAFAPFGPSA